MSEVDDRFEALVRPHARLMAAAIRRVCGRRFQTLVPDIEQEVYLALWKRLASGKEIHHPASYLYRVALTTALHLVRRQAAESASPDAGIENAALAASRGLSAAERRRAIGEVLERLELDEARALRAYLAGFNHLEVARLYGWSESVARHRVYRTLARLAAEASGGKESRDDD